MKKKKPPMGRVPNPAKQSASVIHREGTPIFDTKKRKHMTPGAWHTTDGKVSNVRYWDFWEAEKEARTRTGVRPIYRYDKDGNRL